MMTSTRTPPRCPCCGKQNITMRFCELQAFACNDCGNEFDNDAWLNALAHETEPPEPLHDVAVAMLTEEGLIPVRIGNVQHLSQRDPQSLAMLLARLRNNDGHALAHRLEQAAAGYACDECGYEGEPGIALVHEQSSSEHAGNVIFYCPTCSPNELRPRGVA